MHNQVVSPSESFQTALLADVLEHLEDKNKAFIKFIAFYKRMDTCMSPHRQLQKTASSIIHKIFKVFHRSVYNKLLNDVV